MRRDDRLQIILYTRELQLSRKLPVGKLIGDLSVFRFPAADWLENKVVG